MKMKKYFAVLSAIAITLTAVGCGNADTEVFEKKTTDAVTVESSSE